MVLLQPTTSILRVLPAHTERFIIDGRVYFYVDGLFFVSARRGYVQVAAPHGAEYHLRHYSFDGGGFYPYSR